MKINSTAEPGLQSAAIVCEEVAVQGASILYAKRSEPLEEADSGWQFLCGAAEEDWKARTLRSRIRFQIEAPPSETLNSLFL